MMKIFVCLIFFLVCELSMACEVHLPSHLLIINDSANISKDFAQTNCSTEALNEVNQTISSVDGKITAIQLSEFLKSKNHEVLFQPEFIEVDHLKNLVRSDLVLPPGVVLKSAEAINSPNYLLLAPGDKVNVHCQACLFSKTQALNISVIGFDGSTRSLTISAQFKKMVKAYRVTSFLPAFSDVHTNGLQEDFVESIPHTDLITNLETLKFYKANKPIRAGELLRQSDLNAISLVKAGLKTEVIIESSHVVLKTSGISRSNGSLGEFVEVFHPQKNKKYQGKVIDINKVLVEL